MASLAALGALVFAISPSSRSQSSPDAAVDARPVAAPALVPLAVPDLAAGAPSEVPPTPTAANVRVAPNTIIPGAWTAIGPAPIQNGQDEGITNNPVVGAIHTLAVKPGSSDVIYIGSVNGGIWKTTNGTNASPTWTPLTDDQASASI